MVGLLEAIGVGVKRDFPSVELPVTGRNSMARSYDRRMNALRLLISLALVGATQFAVAAEPVNHCKGPDGRMTMTDRPCGDPATERGAQPNRIVVEQLQAEDIFRARDMMLRDGSSVSPTDGAKGSETSSGLGSAGSAR
jgi:hypothetical protein